MKELKLNIDKAYVMYYFNTFFDSHLKMITQYYNVIIVYYYNANALVLILELLTLCY